MSTPNEGIHWGKGEEKAALTWSRGVLQSAVPVVLLPLPQLQHVLSPLLGEVQGHQKALPMGTTFTTQISPSKMKASFYEYPFPNSFKKSCIGSTFSPASLLSWTWWVSSTSNIDERFLSVMPSLINKFGVSQILPRFGYNAQEYHIPLQHTGALTGLMLDQVVSTVSWRQGNILTITYGNRPLYSLGSPQTTAATWGQRAHSHSTSGQCDCTNCLS